MGGLDFERREQCLGDGVGLVAEVSHGAEDFERVSLQGATGSAHATWHAAASVLSPDPEPGRWANLLAPAGPAGPLTVRDRDCPQWLLR